MPQFPFEPDRKQSQSTGSTGIAADKIVGRQTVAGEDLGPVLDQNKNLTTSPKDPVEPLKFKPTGELKGPVTRVKLDRTTRPKGSKKSPFKDRGLLDDTDSLVQLRESLGKPIAYTLLALTLVYLIYFFSRPVDESAKLEESVRPLITQADQMLVEQEATDVEVMKTRIALSDQLLEFKNSTEAVDKGSELKLRSLTTWDTLNIANQRQDADTTTLMEENSREFINSRNKKVSNLSKVGLMLIRVHKYLEAPNARFFPELLDQFKLIANFAREDLPTARNLLRVAGAFESRSLADESNKLYHAINLTCSTSTEQNISAIANEARSKLVTTTTLYDDLTKMISSGEKIKIDSVRTKINENLTEQTISVSNAEAALDFMDLLTQRNATPAVKFLMEDFSQSVYNLPAGIERDAIKKRYDDSRKRIELVEKVFRFDGVYSVEGRPISRSSFDKQPKMIVFWSPDNSKSIKLLERLSEKTKEFIQRKVKIIAISAIDDTRQSKDRVVEIANDSRGIEFYTLIKDRTPSQAFLGRFPLPKLPYWILLSEDDKVRALDVPPGIIKIDDLY